MTHERSKRCAGELLMKSIAIATLLLAAVQASADTSPRAIIPVGGSTAGAFGSNFRTELQLSNRSVQPMTGRIVFHRQGAGAEPDDPGVAYVLEPHQTVSYPDIAAAIGVDGLGSLDVVLESGGYPTIVARAFDDRGAQGTSGATIEALRSVDALSAGESAVLLLPSDLGRFRYNVGIRTLTEGATLRITVRGTNGISRFVVEQRQYAPELFIQQPVGAFVEGVVLSDESIEIEVLSGSVIAYGTTTDNITNDPSLTLAARLPAESAE